jgi:hypothetical protein
MSHSDDRAAAILARFTAAQSGLVARLRDLPAGAAEFSSRDRVWTAAQVGWHVALSNNWVADVLLGASTAARPAPASFKEGFDPRSLPEKATTLSELEPPPYAGRDSALERLRASGQRLSKAIAALTPERGIGYCVVMSFGTLSLYEFADFAASHISRHAAQVERSLAGV